MSTMLRYLKGLFLSDKKPCSAETSPEEELVRRLKPYEFYLYKIQDVIAWKDVQQSVLFLILVNFGFWFVSYFEWRFFGFFFMVLSLILVHDVWVNHIWPEIRVEKSIPEEKISVDATQPEGVLSLPELSHYATEVRTLAIRQFERMKFLRRTQPALFCMFSTAVWLIVAGIGSVLSGMALLYLFAMSLLTIPGFYIHLISLEQKEVLMKIVNSAYYVILPPESCRNVDEYVPDPSKENLDILAKAGDNSNDLSTPSSDSSMVDLIPGHDESSVDTLDSFKLTHIGKADSSETDSENEVLSFKNTHFNGHSSGEEASLIRDLAFPDIGTLNNQPSTALGITSALTGVFYKTFPISSLSGRLQFRATGEDILPPPNEDSDSEFEIIDEDS